MVFTIDNIPKSLSLSIEGENKIIQYAFDFSEWFNTYGEGTFFIKVQRPTEDTPYIAAAVAIDNNTHIAIWTVTYTDTSINGIGAIELNYVGQNFHRKSPIIKTVITNSLQPEGEAPDAYDDWMTHLAELADTTYDNASSAAQSAMEAKEYRVQFEDENSDGNIEIRWGSEE